MSKRKRTPNVAEFIEDPNLLGPWFAGPSWNRWKSVLKAAFALPMTDTEVALFKEVAGDRDPPTSRVDELWCVAGRRAGKDSVASALVAFAAAVPDYSSRLRPGERATCMSLACDRNQASVLHRYTAAYFRECPLLAEKVASSTAEGLLLDGERVEISTYANSFRSIRGRPSPIVVLSEVAFYRDENSANPDSELYNAVVPSLATLDGMVVGISSPWMQSGLLWDKFVRHFGKNSNILVVKGTSRQFNPTLDQRIVDAALEDDAAAASAEWLGEFRSDITGFLDGLWVERAATLDTGELKPPEGAHVVGAIDPSGGRKDFMAASVAWKVGERIVVGALRARKPPFDPESVVEEFSAMFRRYGVTTIFSDRYGAEWVSSAFAKKGITLSPSYKSASEVFLEAEPLFARGTIDIPADRTLLQQLRNLTRRTVRGGRDVVGHPINGFDDLAVTVCMAAWRARAAEALAITPTAPIVIYAKYPQPGVADYDRVELGRIW